MRKLYLSPTIGTSAQMPANIAQFLESELCNYRHTVSRRQMEGSDPDVPQDIIDSFSQGTEKVSEVVRTIYGEDEEYLSWDSPGVRYYVELSDDFEADLDNLMLNLGLRITLDCYDRATAHGEEWAEIVYGFPMIDEGDRVAEIETDNVPRQNFNEETETESWKNE